MRFYNIENFLKQSKNKKYFKRIGGGLMNCKDIIKQILTNQQIILIGLSKSNIFEDSEIKDIFNREGRITSKIIIELNKMSNKQVFNSLYGYQNRFDYGKSDSESTQIYALQEENRKLKDDLIVSEKIIEELKSQIK